MNSISKDWDQFLVDVGFSKKDVEHYMENVIDTPGFSAIAGKVINIKNQIYYKSRSNIHGHGIFALKNIKKGDTIGVVIKLKDKVKYRSYLGRFTNHSNFKNTVFEELNSGEVIATCIENINVGEEILVDYRDHWGKW
jgi:SET domain-containing protein